MDKNNKIFKVFLVLLVSFSIVFVSLSPSLANNTENLEQAIINYFHERSNCVISITMYHGITDIQRLSVTQYI